MLKHFSITPPENSCGAEMYEMSQRHPVLVAENHINPCNSVQTLLQRFLQYHIVQRTLPLICVFELNVFIVGHRARPGLIVLRARIFKRLWSPGIDAKE